MRQSAFVAALAAAAAILGACGGGGSAPDGGAGSPFSPTTGNEIADGCCYWDDAQVGGVPLGRQHGERGGSPLPSGLTLEDFIVASPNGTPGATGRNNFGGSYPAPEVRYSHFDLESRIAKPLSETGGIPVYIDTKDITNSKGDTYSAIAYRLALEHSHILFAARLGPTTAEYVATPFTSHILMGTYTPADTPISALSGTWSGIAIGQEVPASPLHSLNTRPNSSAVSHVRDTVVEGKVNIELSTGAGADPEIEIAFTDWKGGVFEWPDIHIEAQRWLELGVSRPTSDYPWFGFYWNGVTSLGEGRGNFYGPNFQEVIGTARFSGSFNSNDYPSSSDIPDGLRSRFLQVVYGAKKQDQ